MTTEYTLLLTLGGLFILSPFVKSLSQKVGIPPMVGYISLGFAISAMDQVEPFISPKFETTFYVLSQMGVVALLFRVGMRSHVDALLAKLPTASLVWVGDVLTNLAFGFAIAYFALDLGLETALVIATAFSATSVAVSVAVWDSANKLNTSTGSLLVDVAELDDLSGVLLLAVLLAVLPVLQGQGALWPLVGATTLEVLLKLTLFISGCFLFARYLESKFTRFSRELENSLTALTITILGAGLVIATLAGFLGFSLAIGALFAGLAFSRDPQAVRTEARFGYFYELLTPFFFIHIGMQMEPSVITGSLALGAILFVAAVAGKILGVTGMALLTLKKSDALLLGISMIPRAEIALVVISQSQQANGPIINDSVYNGMVIVCLATSILAPILLRPMLEKT